MEKTVKERLIKFLEIKKISKSEFGRRIGVSSAFITSMRQSMQPDKVKRIALEFPELNTTWLLTGDGEMLNKEEKKLPSIEEDLGSITMPREVWQVIQDQAASLRAKDEILKIKDRQVSEVIALLKQQMKRGQEDDVADQSHVAPEEELG